MLRIHFLQLWFNLADEACEEALYDTALFREFAQIDLGEERVPDATTMLKFRRLLETHDLGRAIFDPKFLTYPSATRSKRKGAGDLHASI